MLSWCCVAVLTQTDVFHLQISGRKKSMFLDFDMEICFKITVYVHYKTKIKYTYDKYRKTIVLQSWS